MVALVLSGGGAKGAYEIGVWKALKKLRIKYDIVTGTSVGALNGVMMVQKDFKKALRIWQNIDYDKIVDDVNMLQKNKVLVCTHNFIHNGGTSVQALEDLVQNSVNEKKFFKSKIDFGLITYNFSKLKPVCILKKNLNKGDIQKYIIASSTCFPFFKKKKINDENYIDGGYYDNLPINLAIDMGAEEVIAVDLKAIGLKKKVKNTNVKITYIAPNNDIGDILQFEKDSANKNICLGFNDTMKVYHKLDGKKFTFKKNDLTKNHKKYALKYYNMVKKFISKTDEFNNIPEKIGSLFEIDESKIYKIKKYNKLLKQKIEEIPELDLNLSIKNMPNYFNKEKLVKLLYSLMKTDSKRVKAYKIFREEIMMATYLMIIK